MELEPKQKVLLITTSVSLLIILLLLAIFERSLWLSILSFLPFVPFCLLTLTTLQKIFEVKKQWQYFLAIIAILQLQIILKSGRHILNYFEFNSKIYGILFFILLAVPYFFFLRKNLKKHS